MKVLIVARCKDGKYAPFISEQVDALTKLGIECQYFGITQKGFLGYLKKLHGLRNAIVSFQPDIIHAHYGLCGLLANLQRRIPVVTTYHGSDINNPTARKLSKWAIKLSAHNVFVSKSNIIIAHPTKNNYSLIPCGINLEDYPIIDRLKAREELGLDYNKKYVLFSGAFGNRVKNAPLAKAAISLLPEVELIELKGFNRPQVALLMQAVNAFLMTSFTEGSPQVIKEAMMCGCPIVSVDVGDVKEMIEGLDGCYISERYARFIAQDLEKAIAYDNRTQGRSVIIGKQLTNEIIALKLKAVYSSVLTKNSI